MLHDASTTSMLLLLPPSACELVVLVLLLLLLPPIPTYSSTQCQLHPRARGCNVLDNQMNHNVCLLMRDPCNMTSEHISDNSE